MMAKAYDFMVGFMGILRQHVDEVRNESVQDTDVEKKPKVSTPS